MAVGKQLHEDILGVLARILKSGKSQAPSSKKTKLQASTILMRFR